MYIACVHVFSHPLFPLHPLLPFTSSTPSPPFPPPPPLSLPQGSTELTAQALPDIAKLLLLEGDDATVSEAARLIHELTKKETSCKAIINNGGVVSTLIQVMASTQSLETQKVLAGGIHNISTDRYYIHVHVHVHVCVRPDCVCTVHLCLDSAFCSLFLFGLCSVLQRCSIVYVQCMCVDACSHVFVAFLLFHYCLLRTVCAHVHVLCMSTELRITLFNGRDAFALA